jgi:hypothetical protein
LERLCFCVFKLCSRSINRRYTAQTRKLTIEAKNGSHFIYKIIPLLIAVGIIFGSVSNSFAQSPTIPSYIVYVVQHADESFSFVYATANQRTVYELKATECSSLSPSGELIAVYDSVLGEITILRLQNQEVVLSKQLRPALQHCNFLWSSDVAVEFLINPTEVQALDIITGDIEQRSSSGSINVETDLPNRVLDNPAIYSPDHAFVIYNRCLDDSVNSGSQSCAISSQRIVLFNTQTNEIVAEFTDTLASVLGDSEQEMGFGLPNPPSVFWSPSGRYVLYKRTDGAALRLYDIQQNAFSTISLPPNALFVPTDALVKWTEDEARVGFWIRPLSDGEMNSFTYFDLGTQQTQTSNPVDDLYGIWEWSPDGQLIAFIHEPIRRLSLLNLSTNTTSNIETGVYDIRTWQD